MTEGGGSQGGGAAPVLEKDLMLPLSSKRVAGSWLAGRSGMLDHMAYDETLAQRIRERLAGIPSLREVKMFGGLSFMVDGHIVAFASRSGDMMVRCPPEDEERLLAEAGDTAQPARIGNRKQQQKTTGWITVRADALTEPVFDRWLDIALDYNQRP